MLIYRNVADRGLCQVCLGAAAALAGLRQLIFRTSVGWLPRRASSHLAVWIPFSLLAVSVLLSAARATALVRNYSAPMKIYSSLPQVTHLCPYPSVWVSSMPQNTQNLGMERLAADTDIHSTSSIPASIGISAGQLITATPAQPLTICYTRAEVIGKMSRWCSLQAILVRS